MSEANPTDNYNSQFEPKPTLQEIDELAAKLCKEYSNYGFYKWYCRVINVLGVQRVKDIRAMYSDTRQARNLFSRRAKEEMQTKQGKKKLRELKDGHAKEKNQPES